MTCNLLTVGGNVNVTYDHRYVSLVVIIISSYPYHLVCNRRVTPHLSLASIGTVFTLPDNLTSSPDFIGVRVAQSLVLCVQ